MRIETRERGALAAGRLDPARAGEGRIRVSLAIEDESLRRRVLAALRKKDVLLSIAGDFHDGDIIVADHIVEADERADVPAIVIAQGPVVEIALRRGYAGGLSLSFTDETLRIAIEAAAHGLRCTERRIEADPAFHEQADAEKDQPKLTIREGQVLQQLMTGASNKEIARRMEISVHTVKFHVASVAAKLGASGRTDAVARALRLARSMV